METIEEKLRFYERTTLVLLFVVFTLIIVCCCQYNNNRKRQRPKTTVKLKYVPLPAETIPQIIPANVDTTTVIKRYYTKLTYRDTVLNNDTVMVQVLDTVYQNGLTGRTVAYNFNKREFKKNNSISIISTYGYKHLSLMGEYRYKRLKFYAGYEFVNHAPIAGIGFQIIEWK